MTHGDDELIRSCGDCAMCCYVLGIEDDETARTDDGEKLCKPKDQWCRHCSGHNCKIYDRRPKACRNFTCDWLRHEMMPEYWYPKKSKIVMMSRMVSGFILITFAVHRKYPLRWREEPYYSFIKKVATEGVRQGQCLTRVVVGDDKWSILPDEDVLIPQEYSGLESQNAA
jgi:hypothetical protein